MLVRFIVLLVVCCPVIPAWAGMPRIFADLPLAGSMPAVKSTSYVYLSQFAFNNGLRLVSRPGAVRIILRAKGLKIILARGLKMVSINNKIYRLTRAPYILNRKLVVPDSLVRMLPCKLLETRVSGTVILDPGHGGRDSGAKANGVREKDVVFDVALRAAKKLRALGVNVILTRKSDCFISLSRRSSIANCTPNAVFVSIHANSLSRGSSKSISVHGIETFILANRISESYRVNRASMTYNLQKDIGRGLKMLSPARERAEIAALSKKARASSVSLARKVQARLISISHDNDRGVRQKNLAVLRENYFGPAILTEIGFISNPDTAAKLRTSLYRDRLAKAISDGIADFLRTRK